MKPLRGVELSAARNSQKQEAAPQLFAGATESEMCAEDVQKMCRRCAADTRVVIGLPSSIMGIICITRHRTPLTSLCALALLVWSCGAEFTSSRVGPRPRPRPRIII